MTKLIDELRRIEAGLRREGLRGHVYILPSGNTIMFATTTGKAHGTVRNIGPLPLVNRVEDVRGNRDMDTWTAALRDAATEGLPVPQTIWNTPHLVITGATPKHAIAMVFEHPRMYSRERLRELAAAAGISSGTELADAYRKATGRRLPDESMEHFERTVGTRSGKDG